MEKHKRKGITDPALVKRRKYVENTAAFGLIVLCAGLAMPFASAFSALWLEIGKWAFTAGTVIFLVARCVDVSDPSESRRLRRLRRMEAWAGIAFGFGAFFWFWNSSRLGPWAGPLTVMRDTIMFALAGAMIQIVASWMIVFRIKKESAGDDVGESGGKR